MANFSDAEDWSDLANPTIVTGWSEHANEGSGKLSSGLVAATRNGEFPPVWSPENPLFWFALILAFGTGAVYISTHVKVGPLSETLTA